MNYQTVTPSIVKQLSAIVGPDFIHEDEERKERYGRDETEDLVYKPAVIIRPRTAEEISEILKLANKELIPVTPRGAGTGLSGGALPIYGGICLSMERFNQILEIDERNLQATVEPG